jgi:hypothetical protein
MDQIKVGDVVHVPANADGYRKTAYGLKLSAVQILSDGTRALLRGTKRSPDGSRGSRSSYVTATVNLSDVKIIEKGAS